MKKEIIRKCSICKEPINIKNEDYIKDVNYKHTKCFRNKEKNKVSNRLSDEVIEIKIKLIKESMKLKQTENDKKELERQQTKNKKMEDKIKENEIKALEKQKIKNKILEDKKEEKYKKEIEKQEIKNRNKKNGITDTINRDKFIKYIQSEYNITLLDKSFFIKLANINNGTYKGLKEGITYEDLLYMFKQKKDYLNKNADRMHRKGNDFKDNKLRLNYDVAVIINKYDAFKEWKEKQKLMQVEKNNLIKDEKSKIDFTYIRQIKQSQSENEGLDINSIVDEI